MRRINLKTWLVMAVFLLAMVGVSAAGRTIYIDCNATGPIQDGNRWHTAFKYLQDGLGAAQSGDEIWVAKGTYKPDEDTLHPNGSGDREATFQLINGVAIYGGFPSGGSTWEDRDPDGYKAILDGNIGSEESLDNSYHVVTGSETDATAVLDGFTTTDSNVSEDYPSLDGNGSIVVKDEKIVPLSGEITFKGLSFLPGGGPDSYAYGISADGHVVVGSSRSAAMYKEAFRWTAEEGMIPLGDLPGGSNYSYACGVSADGSVIVGCSNGEFPGGYNNIQPFRWTLSEGMMSLGFFSPGGGIAYDVCANGSVIVGYSYKHEGYESRKKAFRWTHSEGLIDLGTLIGGIGRSEAYGVSADGTVIVGASNEPEEGDDSYARVAFIWTPSGGMVGLGDMPGGKERNYAKAVSADGSVVVGYGYTINSREAFRWTAEEGMVSLGQLPDGTFARFAEDVSTNGSVIVGETSRGKAFIWDSENGPRLLQEVLENEHDLDLTGWKLERATGVSDDGLTIVGYGINSRGETEAWIVTPRVELGTLIGLEIKGPNEVQERTLNYYKAIACYDSGMKRDVTDLAMLSIDSSTYATITNDGLLHAKEIKKPQDIVIYAQFTVDGVTYEAQKAIRIIFYVPLRVPEDYETIKEAIFNAKDGDIIVVADGVYSGIGSYDLKFGGRAITLRSKNGPENCIIDCRDMGRSFTFDHYEGPDSVLDGFTITNGYASSGGAIYCSSGLGRSSPTICNCIFLNNRAGNGGAIYNSSGTGSATTSPNIIKCLFVENKATKCGGAIYNRSSTGNAITNPTILTCTFSGNTAEKGGGIYNSSGTGSAQTMPSVVNCTITRNSATFGGGAMYNRQGISLSITLVKVANSILWNNEGNEIVDEKTTTDVSYSCIEGGWPGTGNINIDPCFVEPDNNDFHLRPDSPCINAGDPHFVPKPEERDIDGEPRVWDGRVDMGADEFVPAIEVLMKFTPQALNPKSKGNWVKTHFVLPEGFIVEDVDVNRPAVIEPLGIESDYMNVFVNEDGLVEIEAGFDRAAFCAAGPIDGTVTVIGAFDSGQYFYGTDTIKIITNNLKYLGVLASHWLDSGCVEPDWCSGLDVDQDSVVNFVDFAMFDGCCIEAVK